MVPMVGRENLNFKSTFQTRSSPTLTFSLLGATTRRGPEPAMPGVLLPTPATSPSPCQCGPQTTCTQTGGVGAVRSGPQAILCPGLEGRAHPNASASVTSSLHSSPFSSPLRHPRCQGQTLTSSSCPAPYWSLCQALLSVTVFTLGTLLALRKVTTAANLIRIFPIDSVI
jgi:hypothetical protein